MDVVFNFTLIFKLNGIDFNIDLIFLAHDLPFFPQLTIFLVSQNDIRFSPNCRSPNRAKALYTIFYISVLVFDFSHISSNKPYPNVEINK